MTYKPMKRRDYLRWIRQYGLQLVKAGMDWKLVNGSGSIVIKNIIVTHPGNEIAAISVQKTEAIIQTVYGG